MKLTQKQEWLVARYLRAVGDELGDVPDTTRERAVADVKARVAQGMSLLGTSLHRDEDILGILRQLGSPKRQAEEFLFGDGGSRILRLDVDNRIWLGVCAGLARSLGVKAGVVRLAAVILGLTGPLALIAYIVLYLEMYLSSPSAQNPPIDRWRVVRYGVGTPAAAVAMYMGIGMIRELVGKAYTRIVWVAVPPLGAWDWLRSYQSLLLLGTLFVCLPTAVLSALPLANGWDLTGKRIVQACLAVYALVLCLGIACYLVGVMLQAVERMAPL